MKKALVIIDMQYDCFAGGAAEVYKPVEAAEKARLLLEHFRETKQPVFFVKHYNTWQGAKSHLPNTKGAEIHELVAPNPDEDITVKYEPNSFHKTGFSEKLSARGIDHLVVCGFVSQMCIDTSVRSARDYGFSTTLIHNACAAMDLTWDGKVIPAETVHNTFMASMRYAFARVISAEEYLKEAASE